MSTFLYPPILESSQPAFVPTESYRIYFTIPETQAVSDIGHVQIRLAYQTSNEVIGSAPDGLIYKMLQQDATTKEYYVTINSEDFESGVTWTANVYYKVQLRFGAKTELYSSTSTFAAWTKDNSAGDWSTIMLLKIINAPTVIIPNASTDTEVTSRPKIYGSYSVQSDEMVNKYQFILKSGSNTLEDSGWLQHDSTTDNNISGITTSTDNYRFKTMLTNGTAYTVIYNIITVNNYNDTAVYDFTTALEGNELQNCALATEAFNRLGVNKVTITATDDFTTSSIVITRAAEDDDYTDWTQLKTISLASGATYTYIDYTIESGKKYKYAVQGIGNNDIWSEPITSSIVNCDFDFAYLCGNNKQLCLPFDYKISNFKYVTQMAKQDTIGSKYATILKNGYSYYATFSLGGLITIHMNDELFLKEQEQGYYYDFQLLIPSDKYTILDKGGTVLNGLSYNLKTNDIFVERKFREAVIDFLSNGDYKIFKSPTEGNMVVILTDVSLTPKEELGNMIYSFSCTAYEVMENTLDNLISYGVI